MSDDRRAILRLEHVSKVFAKGSTKENTAVRDLSLSVSEGEALGIVGESGCGKSTLARMITLLESVSEGKIFFYDKDITRLGAAERKAFYREVQMVFQNPYGTFSPRMTIGDFMTESLRYHGIMKAADAKKKAIDLMEQVDLSADLMNRFPHEFSGGQLQRVVIARALSIEPKLLILDEPTSALDVSAQKTFLKMLAERLSRDGISCVLIGHDLSVVRSVTHRIAVMYAGTIMEILPSETMMSDAEHPYTEDLLESIFTLEHVHAEKKEDSIRKLTSAALRMNRDVHFAKKGCPYQERCRYADDRCRSEVPELLDLGNGHYCACFQRKKRS